MPELREGPATIAEPDVEVQGYVPPLEERTCATPPSWGRRGTLWEWLVVVAVASIFLLLFARTTFDRAERLGSEAFPKWYWRIYDWKVWPLNLFR